MKYITQLQNSLLSIWIQKQLLNQARNPLDILGKLCSTRMRVRSFVLSVSKFAAQRFKDSIYTNLLHYINCLITYIHLLKIVYPWYLRNQSIFVWFSNLSPKSKTILKVSTISLLVVTVGVCGIFLPIYFTILRQGSSQCK